MNTKFDFNDAGALPLVYVRPVDVAELPQDVQDQAEAQGADQLYAVHDADGERLALVANRELAFVLARQHDMAPVPVH